MTILGDIIIPADHGWPKASDLNTTTEGMADIGYVGNVPLPKFEGPPPEIRRRLGI